MDNLELAFQQIWLKRTGGRPLAEQLFDLAAENKLDTSTVIHAWNKWRDGVNYTEGNKDGN